jgi:hypothetical protein
VCGAFVAYIKGSGILLHCTVMCNVCLGLCKMYLYVSICNKTENKHNLSGIKLNAFKT